MSWRSRGPEPVGRLGVRAACTVWVGCLVVGCALVPAPPAAAASNPPPQVYEHLAAIASFAEPSPVVTIPAGWFLMGTIRIDDDPYGLATQYDNTELPRRRIWLDAYQIDRHEVTLGEYLAYLRDHDRDVSPELAGLVWHLISVHYIPDEVLAPWPALYVTWEEAADFCRMAGKRLPSEAEWEKAARGTDANLFPWGEEAPTETLAVFGQYHVHEIPLVAAVDSYEEGRSPYGLHHMAGNMAEWTADWFSFDYYAIMPDRNPPGPGEGRYKAVRGGSWRSKPNMLRTATRGGAFPSQREPTIGFRCARSLE